MECFQNKTLEQGRKRETASETNIPPRSDTLWVKNETASPNEKARFAVTPPNLSLRAKRSSLVLLGFHETLKERLLRKRKYHLAVTGGGGKRETLHQKKMRLTVKFLSSVTVRVSFLSFSCERSFSVTGSFVSSLNL